MSELSVNFEAGNPAASEAQRLASKNTAHTKPRELDLIRGLANGDQAAMQNLIETHGEMLSRLVGRLTGWHSDRDDILQDVLLAVWQQAKSYQGNGSFEGWLRSIAINRCRNHFRAKGALRRMIKRLTNLSRPQSTDPDPQTEHDETKQLLQTALAELSQPDRTVLVLFYLEEIPGAQIAELLKIKTETLHVRLHRARQKLKTLIEDDRDKFI